MPALTGELIAKATADKVGLQKNQSAQLVEILNGLIQDSLISGDDVLINGFGKFSVKSRRERRGRKPATGDSMPLKARKAVTFHCSGKLRARLKI
jgi:integration host factor subunit alpha